LSVREENRGFRYTKLRFRLQFNFKKKIAISISILPIVTALIAIYVAHSVVFVSVCLLGTQMSCAKMAEPIVMPLGGGADSRRPKEPRIRWGLDPPTGRGKFQGGHIPPTVTYLHMANVPDQLTQWTGDTTRWPLAKLLYIHVYSPESW